MDAEYVSNRLDQNVHGIQADWVRYEKACKGQGQQIQPISFIVWPCAR